MDTWERKERLSARQTAIKASSDYWSAVIHLKATADPTFRDVAEMLAVAKVSQEVTKLAEQYYKWLMQEYDNGNK